MDYGRVHDTILFYCKSEAFTWHTQLYCSHSEEFAQNRHIATKMILRTVAAGPSSTAM